MGFTKYSASVRTNRATTLGYNTKGIDEIFTQQKQRIAHDTMLSKGMSVRECRDSDEHPNTQPIILSLDVTGSMGDIPHMLIKEGLPTVMTSIIDKGCVDASLLFMAVGDHNYDRYPLQVAQFESGDEELDMWLTRTYLEGGGGANSGESYQLAWLTALNKTETDAWEKRNQKGILISIGDEPVLTTISKSAIEEVYGESLDQGSINTESILKEVQEKWDVYHIHIKKSQARNRSAETQWKELLGQNCIVVDTYKDIPSHITDIVINGGAVLEPTEVKTPINHKPVDIDSEFDLF